MSKCGGGVAAVSLVCSPSRQCFPFSTIVEARFEDAVAEHRHLQSNVRCQVSVRNCPSRPCFPTTCIPPNFLQHVYHAPRHGRIVQRYGPASSNSEGHRSRSGCQFTSRVYIRGKRLLSKRFAVELTGVAGFERNPRSSHACQTRTGKQT